MWTTLDLFRPTENLTLQLKKSDKSLSKQKQEEQYNRRHGVKSKIFEPGMKVYVQIHTYNKWSWILGEIIEKVGRVIYNILVNTRSRLV